MKLENKEKKPFLRVSIMAQDSFLRPYIGSGLLAPQPFNVQICTAACGRVETVFDRILSSVFVFLSLKSERQNLYNFKLLKVMP